MSRASASSLARSFVLVDGGDAAFVKAEEALIGGTAKAGVEGALVYFEGSVDEGVELHEQVDAGASLEELLVGEAAIGVDGEAEAVSPFGYGDEGFGLAKGFSAAECNACDMVAALPDLAEDGED